MDRDLEIEPAGFWRRAIAYFIDWAICALILAFLAAILFAMTGGRVQMQTSLVPERCWDVDPLPSQLKLPPDFKPNQAKFCQQRLLNWPVVQTLTLSERTSAGSIAHHVRLQLLVDADQMTWTGSLLAAPTSLLLVLFRLVFDSRACSPGRRVCGLVVVERATGSKAPFSRLWRRYLLFSIPGCVGYLCEVSVSSAKASFNLFELAGNLWLLIVLSFMVNLPLTIWIIVAIVRRQPTFYDRPVGTGVQRRKEF